MMIVLGIDPGLATVGFGIIEVSGDDPKYIDSGVITTASSLEMGERLSIIKNDLKALIDQFKPDFVGVEQLYFAKNVTNALLVAQARGVILESVHSYGLPITEFTPLQVKNNITGDGSADKLMVQTMVQRFLNLNALPKPDDAADALAIALCTGRVQSTTGF